MRWWGLLAILAACYRAPSPSDPCAISCTDVCPGELTCQGGYCVGPGQVCRPLFAQVAAGTGFACGIDESDALWCWGSNAYHQIAPGDRLQYPLATRIDGREWEALDAGGEHVCGIASGQLYCWGRNDRGQAGLGPDPGDVDAPTAITVPDPPSRWTAVAAGELSTCAIGDGRLYCWGANPYGLLGNGTQDVDASEPTAVQTGLVDWTAVDIGSYHACAVSAGSGVFCWGYSGNGRIGPNAIASSQTSPVLALAAPAASVAVSENATCAAMADGALMCWGDNGGGELGPDNAGVLESATPLRASGVGGWTAVTAAADKLCGLAGDAVYCWGSASLGGLGSGVWSEQDRFVRVMSGARAISLGWNRDIDVFGTDRKQLELACALVGTEVQCWGDNRYGQLGRGGATMAVTPEEIDGGHLWTKISLGASHGCGIAEGSLYCWGSTVNGQTIGMLTGASSPRTPCMPGLDCDLGTPKPIGFAPGLTDVVAGAAHTCALHNDLITCWGSNSAGQLGTGAAAPFKRDVPQPGGRPWKALLPTGREGQCASPGGAEVWCWGYVISQHQPMRELALDGVRALGVGETMTCALDAGGMLQCFGSNGQGQFGTGSPVASCPNMMCSNGETAQSCQSDCGPGPLTPTGRTYEALAVSSSSSFACGVRGGLVECWGANDRGQTGAVELGTATLINPTFTPRPVEGLSGCTAVTAGDVHACAICGGRIHCWGDHSTGSLGAGPLTRDPVPVPREIDLLLEGDPWVELASGTRFSCARSEAGRVYCWGSDPHAGLGNGATSANLPVTVLASPVR